MAKPFPFSDKKLILASSSPRRRYLLRLIRLKHIVAEPDVKEDDHADDDPIKHVMGLSRLKALSVRDSFKEGYILGADTIVVLDGEILEKPGSEPEARQMLTRLAGRLHHVFTGLAIIDAATGEEAGGYEKSGVRIREMSADEIEAYVATGEPMDKAGSYGIQGYGAAIVERVEGCYFNVVGLPVVRLLKLIRELDRICGGS